MLGAAWKRRALEAEEKLRQASANVTMLTKIQADRAALMSIVAEGRVWRFTFVRNGVMTQVETYAPMSESLAAIKEALLQ